MKVTTPISAHLVRLILISGLMLCCTGESGLRAQDSDGASTGIIIVRDNPVLRTPSRPRPPRRPDGPNANSRSKPSPAPDINQLFEAALERANTARNDTPPRYADAEREYQQATALLPQDPRGHAGLGFIYYQQKRWTEARAKLGQAVRLGPSDEVSFILLGYIDQTFGDYPASEAAARSAAALKPDDYRPHYLLAGSLIKQRRYAEAEASYRRVLELTPQFAEPRAALGEALFLQNRFQDAAAQISQALRLAWGRPKYKTYYQAIYAHAVYNLGWLEIAAEQWQQVIQVNSVDQPGAEDDALKLDLLRSSHANLGLTYYHRGKFAAAKTAWQTAIRLGSTYPVAAIGVDILGRHFAEARRSLERYTRESGEDVDGWLLLGDVCRALGDKSSARAAYQQAAVLTPGLARLPRPAKPST